MNKRTIMLTAAVFGTAGALASAGVAAGSSNGASLVIRHQVKGCHEWSLNGGSYGVVKTVKLSRGGTLSITDNHMWPRAHQAERPAIERAPGQAGRVFDGEDEGSVRRRPHAAHRRHGECDVHQAWHLQAAHQVARRLHADQDRRRGQRAASVGRRQPKPGVGVPRPPARAGRPRRGVFVSRPNRRMAPGRRSRRSSLRLRE